MTRDQSDPSNSIYNDIIDYKDKTCAGSKCKNSKTYLFQMSLTIGSSFLCEDCKRDVNEIGWTLQRIEYVDDKKVEKQNSNRQNDIKNSYPNIKRTNKGNRSNSKTLPKLQ